MKMRITYYILLIVLALLSGCVTTASKVLPISVRPYEIPTVAVLDFENKVQVRYNWNIGRGVRDVLVDELVKSRRYEVLSRAEIGDVIGEIEMQRSPYFREEGRVKTGKLKNAKYLIKGSINDFAHVAGGGIGAFVGKLGLGGGGDVAVVSVTLYVIDVESGEIVASESINGKAYAGKIKLDAYYSNVGFGGEAFYRTPLGKAMKEAIGKCLKSISTAIADKKWHPAVVKINADHIIISGGMDRALKAGSRWAAFKEGEKLIDPTSGDVLGREEETITGHAEIVETLDKYSKARVLDGNVEEGQKLKSLEEGKKPRREGRESEY